MHNYAKHYKAVHVQDGECGAGPRKPDFPSKLRCLFEQQALYNLCRSHKYLSVSPGGVCFINSGTTTYRWRFKFYLTCCVLVSPRTNVDYFIYIKKLAFIIQRIQTMYCTTLGARVYINNRAHELSLTRGYCRPSGS